MASRALTREELEVEARNLPRDERTRLVEALISSLDEESEIEVAWREEIRKRVAELDSGSVETLDGETVMSELEDITQS